jgi:hypothetical protein
MCFIDGELRFGTREIEMFEEADLREEVMEGMTEPERLSAVVFEFFAESTPVRGRMEERAQEILEELAYHCEEKLWLREAAVTAGLVSAAVNRSVVLLRRAIELYQDWADLIENRHSVYLGRGDVWRWRVSGSGRCRYWPGSGMARTRHLRDELRTLYGEEAEVGAKSEEEVRQFSQGGKREKVLANLKEAQDKREVERELEFAEEARRDREYLGDDAQAE